VSYQGWRITTPDYIVREFIALCDAKFQFEVYGTKPLQPDRMMLGTMNHKCPKCQNEMLLDAPPEDLKPVWKNNLLALLGNITCEDCQHA
jgi:hypothetical protein